MLDRKIIFAATVTAIGAFTLTEAVLTALERKKERIETGMACQKEMLDDTLCTPRVEWIFEDDSEMLVLERPEDSEMLIPDEKPNLDSFFTPIHENVFDKEELREEEEMREATEEALEKIGKTKWGTTRVDFDDEGMPVFSQKEWDSEKFGINLISQEQYESDEFYPLYDRDQAIWYPKDGLLADQEFNLLNVVNCVGPGAFSMMIESRGGIIYIKNDNLDKCYELWENDIDFEETLNESGFADNVQIQLE